MDIRKEEILDRPVASDEAGQRLRKLWTHPT
jgi:hypothetical protein